MSLETSRQKWLKSIVSPWLAIGNFTKKVDRIALSKYAITGELLQGEVGSVVMYLFPGSYSGHLSNNECVFQAINIERLIKTRLTKSSNIVDAAIAFILDSIDRMRFHIMENELIIDLHFQIVEVSNHDLLCSISSLDPYTMSWSNILDYCSAASFHQMARSCSGNNTVHYSYSMNWPRKVFGASVVDISFENKEGLQLLDKCIDDSHSLISTFYDLIGASKLVLKEPVDDPRNIIDYILENVLKTPWVNDFFARAGLKDQKKQLYIEKSFYNLFSRTPSTVFFTFTYDPEINLVPIKKSL